jgi:glutathione S-transferase
VGDAYSVADIAVFAYTHLAPEAGHDLTPFPKLSGWLQRFRQQPGWFPLE